VGSLQQPGTRLAANLFDDQEHVVVVDKVEVKGPDEFVCFGRVEGYPDSYAILASVDGAMAGTITVPGQAPFQVQYLGDGVHRINEVAPLPAGWCATRSGVTPLSPPEDDGNVAVEPRNASAGGGEPISGYGPIQPMGVVVRRTRRRSSSTSCCSTPPRRWPVPGAKPESTR
jgi:hypothetical protein